LREAEKRPRVAEGDDVLLPRERDGAEEREHDWRAQAAGGGDLTAQMT